MVACHLARSRSVLVNHVEVHIIKVHATHLNNYSNAINLSNVLRELVNMHSSSRGHRCVCGVELNVTGNNDRPISLSVGLELLYTILFHRNSTSRLLFFFSSNHEFLS